MNLFDLYKAVKTGYAPDIRTMGYARVLRNAAASVIKTLSGALPLSFAANGRPLLDYTLYGAMVQDGTPTTSAPVDVQGCGDYDAGTGLYKIPVSVQSEDGVESVTTVYLDKPIYKIGEYADCVAFSEGFVKWYIKELVLTGNEVYGLQSINDYGISNFYVMDQPLVNGVGLSTHLKNQTTFIAQTTDEGVFLRDNIIYLRVTSERASTVSALKSYLSDQYNNGTPVKVYYVLKVPETESIDLPTIPTFGGTNTLDAITAVKPSNMEIKYR